MTILKRSSFIMATCLITAAIPLQNSAFAQENMTGTFFPAEMLLAVPSNNTKTEPKLEVAPVMATATVVRDLLTLDRAIAQALAKSPVLAASASRADAATASRSQAGALPNPEISIDADNIYGDGPYDGFNGAEITYGVSQLVELPGKRGNRIKVAEAEKTKIHYARDGARLDLIRDVTIAYAELATAQQEVEILDEEYSLASEVFESVSARVEAGKEPSIQRNKAGIERSSSEIAREKAKRNLSAKERRLSALMGGDVSGYTVDINDLNRISSPKSLDFYRSRLFQTPDVQTLESDVNQARAGLSLEKANAFPDPTFNFGVKDMREDDRTAYVAGVSFPFPVFNINRAGIQRAGHELNAALMDQKGGQLGIDSDLVSVYGDFASAYNEAMALGESVLPGAEESFSFARQGYEAGKFGYLDVLDAQRTLFDTRKQFNQAVLDYHRQRAVIERMTALHDQQHSTQDNNQ